MTLSASLQHRFGAFALNVAFEAPPGVTALFGRSGAGKSSVLRAVAGLLAPDSGTITLHGKTLLGPGTHVPVHRRRIGCVFQDALLFPHMTVRRNMDYGARFARGPALVRRDDVLEILGIGHLMDRRPATLSGGEKQRVAIARALMSAPVLLAMDEPLASLDAPRKQEILPYIERIKRETGLPVLYVSHSVDEITRLADHLVVLEDGRVAANGPVFDVLSDPDLFPIFGVRDGGAVIEGRVLSHAPDGLSRVQLRAGTVETPELHVPVGSMVRLRVRASDVLIATQPPEGLSAINVLPARVTQIRTGRGPGAVVVLDAAGVRLLSRVTARTVQRMGLKAGLHCFAVIKAMSGS